MSDTRELRIETLIDAPVEAVWKAIAEAEGITTWFAPQARLKPGPDGGMVGGNLWLSWGEGMEGENTIEIWEPNHRLQTSNQRQGCLIVVDYILESRGGSTLLRLVQSGFGRGTNWDDELDASRKAWPIFFRVLKHNVEMHAGEQVRQVVVTVPVPKSPEEQWAGVLQGQLDGRHAGDRFSITFLGDQLEGTIDRLEDRGVLCLLVENWNHALLTLFCETCGNAGMLTAGCVLYGGMVEQSGQLEERWKRAIAELFAA